MKNSLLLFSLVTVAAGVGELAFSPKMAQGAELCNYRNEIVRVSGAYVNKDEAWVTKGWWFVQPGECMTYPDNWYTYVEVDRDQTVERTYLLGEGIETIKLCVIQDRYTFYNGETERVCDKHDYGFSDNSMQTFYLIGSNREVIGYKQ
ncbi:DUF1036 domain-containing protein [Crocosphaera sp. XPORK-15E]|uniref:DUF1036 domain-containing protein n=1 Tax=Crocosphaera sp. XPORK-15E TaxID=3110247 RepID=UPI002B1F95F9|nr:DUF1036 domain-containing protein [Crocosphaera sp. XPORK-15E]MEA5533330.1 DUF1036 domain-containing protein [Crocosphaera sp. XPORK-15E]